MQETLSRLFRVRKTVTTMLQDRGYVVMDEDKNMTWEAFVNKFGLSANIRDELTMLAPHSTDPKNKIFVFFAEPEGDSKKKLGVKQIRKYTEERMEKEGVHNAVLIVSTTVTPYARQFIQTYDQKNFHVELFKETELLVNITEHELVPKHKVLTEQEKQAVLRKYKLKETQLPRIQLQDPVARYLGLKRGQVVRIVRISETAGKYVTYRYVS